MSGEAEPVQGFFRSFQCMFCNTEVGSSNKLRHYEQYCNVLKPLRVEKQNQPTAAAVRCDLARLRASRSSLRLKKNCISVKSNQSRTAITSPTLDHELHCFENLDSDSVDNLNKDPNFVPLDSDDTEISQSDDDSNDDVYKPPRKLKGEQYKVPKTTPVISEFNKFLHSSVGWKRKESTINQWVSALSYLICFLYGKNPQVIDKIEAYEVVSDQTRLLEFVDRPTGYCTTVSGRITTSRMMRMFVQMMLMKKLTAEQRLQVEQVKAIVESVYYTALRARKEEHKPISFEKQLEEKRWSSLQELEQVCVAYEDSWSQLVAKAKTNLLSRAERKLAFIIFVGFLFIRVKASRPQSFVSLTLGDYDLIMKNGYVKVDRFKTSHKYLFDALKFTPQMLKFLEEYKMYIRCQSTTDEGPNSPLLVSPQAGAPLRQLSEYLKEFVHSKIGITLIPTDIRVIYSSWSHLNLGLEDRAAVSHSLCHSNSVVSSHYLNLKSLEVAEKDLRFYQQAKGISTSSSEISNSSNSSVDSNSHKRSASPNTTEVEQNEPNAQAKRVKLCGTSTDSMETDSIEVEQQTSLHQTAAPVINKTKNRKWFTDKERQFIKEAVDKVGLKWVKIKNLGVKEGLFLERLPRHLQSYWSKPKNRL